MGIGLIAGGLGVLGDIMSSQGQQDTNAQNAAIASANRNFQAQQNLQVEGWEQNMSDTAMQRRVTDLRAAGLNPMLAISQGGASQPSVGTPSGSTAQMQNPSASFGNLGQQASSAISTSAQVNLQNAQADQAAEQAKLIHSQTPQGNKETDEDGTPTITNDAHALGNATVDNIKANTGVATQTAQQVAANVNLINTNLKNTDADTALKNIQAATQGQNLDIIRATKAAVIQQATAQGAHAGNLQSVYTGPLGSVITYLNAILEPMHTASQMR